jgi:drug/metabolite transporter (DMT)-like permease
MAEAHLIGVSLALVSAMGYGVADFSGGRAARRQSPFQVLALAGFSGWIVLAMLELGFERQLPTGSSAAWAAAAGVFGALGIASFYQALAIGRAAVVAPTATVIGTMMPFLFGLLTIGWPKQVQMLGLVCAFFGVGLVSYSNNADNGDNRQGLLLAVLAGLGFGGFFIFIAQVDEKPFFAPLMIARTVTIVLALVFIRLRRQNLPGVFSNPLALLAGMLDISGNIFFMLARQFTRMDLAAVLVGLCPAVTVLLARIILKEMVSFSQWVGVALCILAATLISV